MGAQLQVSGGGVPAHALWGGAPQSADLRYGVPADAIPVPGSFSEYPEGEQPCSMMKLDGSGPCTAPRVRDDDVCVGHQRSREKMQKGS